MTSETPSEFEHGSESANHEEKLCDLVAAYVERLSAGERIEPEEILSEEPELGPAILEELEAFVFLGESASRGVSLGTLGDYTLRRQIGRGGMGVVFEAWQNSVERAVALKVLPGAVAADDKAFHRFMREARTAAKLGHPNIVGVYGMGQEENTPYFAMEFVEGETLAQILSRFTDAKPEAETPFGPKDQVDYFAKLARSFADVADGLQHAHSKGVIHRDIKPSNLILDAEGRLRILDFGLARIEGQESLTLSGDFVGTPLYMSPEQARRRKIPVDHRTDVYSLGATMYEMLTGQPPFRGKDHADTLSRIIEREPVEPCKLVPRIPTDLETIVLKCLRKDTGDRYGTAEALAQDLRRFVRGDPIEARPLSRWEVTVGWLWRQRARIGTVSAVAISIAAILALVLVVWSVQNEQELKQYENLISNGIDSLEMELLTSPLDQEAEVFSLGLLYPNYKRQQFASESGPAVEQFLRATEIVPGRPEGYVYLSRAYHAWGKKEEAWAALDEALRRDHDFLPALLLKSYQLRQNGDEDGADALLSSLSHVCKQDWQQDSLDAHLAAMQADWSRAETLYTKLIRNGARPFAGFQKELRLKRGRISLAQEHGMRALRDFHHVRELSGGAIGPTLVLAAAYFGMDEREEAWLVIQEAVASNSSDNELYAAVCLLTHFGETERAFEVADRIEDTCRRFHALLRAKMSVEFGEAALAAGCDDPHILCMYAEALINAKRTREALQLLEDARLQRPDDPNLLAQSLRVRYFLCDYDNLIASCENHRENPDMGTHLGWAYIRKGEMDRAVTELSAEIESNPRAFVAYYGRSWVHSFRGDYDAAVHDILRLLSLSPAWGSGQMLPDYYTRAPQAFLPYWDEFDSICAAAVRRKILAQPRYLGFRALACINKKDPDPALALRLAEESVEATKDRPPRWRTETLLYLGEVQAGRGEFAEAIRTLEQAEALPVTLNKSSGDLGQYRKELYPHLVSCASIDAFLDGTIHEGPDPTSDLDRVQDAMASASPALHAYFDACLLTMRGDLDGARQLLEPLVLANPQAEPSMVLRLADLLSRTAHETEALTLIEGRFAESPMSAPWTSWMRIASDAGLALPHLLERLTATLARVETAAEKNGILARDTKWLLECLLDEGAVRIHCGGGDYVDTQGRRWGRDRFYEGGKAYGNPRPDLAIEVDHDLYYDHRVFDSGIYSRNGYRIPVPDAKYNLILHFCATDPRPRKRKFHLLVEGQPVGDTIFLEQNPGLGALLTVRLEIEISDGTLDLRFEPLPGCRSMISAIALQIIQ